MPDLLVEEALVVCPNDKELRWQAWSEGFAETWRAEWEPFLAAQSAGFGVAPAASAVLVRSLPERRIGLCRVAELGSQPALGRSFQLLVLSADGYRDLTGDPFAIFATCEANWHARGLVPPRRFSAAPPPRTVAQVCEVIQQPDSAALLGAAQALVDGGRVAWVRPQPDTALLRSLWLLLPIRTRAELCLASFAGGMLDEFHVVVVPVVRQGDFDQRYLSEEQAANYPEGRYELGVQSAAEAGDQRALDTLFARRSRADTWRLGLWLAGSLIVLTIAVGIFKWIMGR